MQSNREVINSLYKLCKKYPELYNRNQILCSSLSSHVLYGFFGGFPNSRTSEKMKNHMIQNFLSEIVKKNFTIFLNNLALYGRMNDSIEYLQEAIRLGNLTARADLALLCFKLDQRLSHDECKKIFKLVKEGCKLGCRDCEGMLAHFYETGYHGVVTPNYELAYHHAIESADSGSLFGKFALAVFLNFYSTYQDEYDDEIVIFCDDKFICNFTKKYANDSAINADDAYDADDSADDSDYADNADYFDDNNIVNRFEQKRIAILLFDEIKREKLRNPTMPKVWLNI